MTHTQLTMRARNPEEIEIEYLGSFFLSFISSKYYYIKYIFGTRTRMNRNSTLIHTFTWYD